MRSCGVIAFLIFLIMSGLAGVGVSRVAPPGFTFTADTTLIPAGGCVVLSWNVPRAVQLTITGSNWPDGSSMDAENSGTSTACPSAAALYVPNEPVIYTLTAIYNDGSSETQTITITYEGAVPNPPPLPTIFSPTLVPTPITLAALYQPFEHGFMLHRVGENCVFAFVERSDTGEQYIVLDPAASGQPNQSTSYCIRIESLPELISPTPEIFGIDQTIGRVWHAHPEVQAALGQPIGAAFLYTGTIPLPSTEYGAPFYTAIGTLPDGRTLWCGVRAPFDGICVVE